MRRVISTAVVAMLVGACVTASSAVPHSPDRSSTSSSALVLSSPSAGPAHPASPDSRLASIDAAQARWDAHKPATFAYTYTHRGPGGVGWDWRFRVTSLDGRIQVQNLDGYTQSVDDPAMVSITVLFDLIRNELTGSGQTTMDFDPELGYPTEVAHSDPRIADAEGTETVTDFVSGSHDGSAATRAAIRSARTTWQRWEPAAYSYVWRRFGPTTASAVGTAWDIEHVDGRTTTLPDPDSDGELPSDAASIDSTFDAVETAVDAGAWVDLTVDATSGLPLLVAVDPSPAVTGDEYWIRISFRDTQREVARAALDAAQVRWADAGLKHFSYTWRYRGKYQPLTYWVTWDDDVSALRRAPRTPIPESFADATPRIDDTFRVIGAVLEQGGYVIATYDPVFGYPIRVEIDPVGDAGPPGIITIKDFKLR